MGMQMYISLETNVNLIYYPMELNDIKHSAKYKENTSKCLLNLLILNELYPGSP